MKTKIVLWGTNDQEERILLALELRAEDNKVNIYTFEDRLVTEEFNQKMMKDWRDGLPVEFPEEHNVYERELTITESLLPENLKVERGDLIQRAQTEWHFIVLSAKLNATYQSELDALRDRVHKLEAFDSKAWDSLKQFWAKVQTQVRERNLFREHADALRDNTNVLFAKLKELRSKLDDEFKKLSQANHDDFVGKLEEIENKIKEGLRLQPIFDELKNLQRQFRESKLTREHRSKVWQKLDGAFKTVKEKRFGSKGDDRSPLERIQRRYEGLLAAIEKMERSIGRDKDDLSFQNKKIETTDGQLEVQIRQAKILMIQERIRSKEEKLGEMLQTKTELEKRIEQQKEKEAKRMEKEKLAEAKKAAEAKIAEEIKQAEAARESQSEKLSKAAEAIGANKKSPAAEEVEAAPPKEGLLSAAATAIGEVMQDAVDTVKAVAEVVGDKIEEAVDELKEEVKEFTGTTVEDKEEEVEKSSDLRENSPDLEGKSSDEEE